MWKKLTSKTDSKWQSSKIANTDLSRTFTIRDFYNNKNDVIYAEDPSEIHANLRETLMTKYQAMQCFGVEFKRKVWYFPMVLFMLLSGCEINVELINVKGCPWPESFMPDYYMKSHSGS